LQLEQVIKNQASCADIVLMGLIGLNLNGTLENALQLSPIFPQKKKITVT